MHVQVIDFRNGRYQGQVYQQQPHGFGCFLTLNFAFIAAQWQQGKIQGNTLIVYPNGSMYTGEVEEGKATGVGVVELGSDGMRMWRKGDRAVAYLPKNGSIFELDLIKEQVLKVHRVGLDTQKIAQLLEIGPNHPILTTYFHEFYLQKFYQKHKGVLEGQDLPHRITKQCKIGFNQGLRVNIKHLQGLQDDRLYAGRDYLVSEIGCYDSDNRRQGMGYSTISDHIRGLFCQQGIYGNIEQIYKYGQNQQRPIDSFRKLIGYQKSSLLFRDQYVDSLTGLQMEMLKIHHQIIRPQQEAIMQRQLEIQQADQRRRKETTKTQAQEQMKVRKSSPEHKIYNQQVLQKAKEQMLDSLKDRKSGKIIKQYTEQLYNPIESFAVIVRKKSSSPLKSSPKKYAYRANDVLTQLNTPDGKHQYKSSKKSDKKISSPSRAKQKAKKNKASKISPENKESPSLRGVVLKSARPSPTKPSRPKVIFREDSAPSSKQPGSFRRFPLSSH